MQLRFRDLGTSTANVTWGHWINQSFTVLVIKSHQQQLYEVTKGWLSNNLFWMLQKNPLLVLSSSLYAVVIILSAPISLST